MRPHNRMLLAAFSILFLVSFGSVLVADEETMTFKGDLVRVNADSNSFFVRDADQKEIEFSYNDKTEISGETKTIEGLAGQTGTEVTVQYRKEGTSNVATKLEVHSKHSY